MPQIQHDPSRLVHWRMMLQSWVHSRKALIFLAVFVVASIGLFAKLLNAGQWIDVVKWSATSYMAANVVDGAAQALGKGQQ
jgi:hypothetical protein